MQKRLAALASSERGIAIPTVLSVMVIGLGFSAVAVTASITAQSGTTQDQNRKDALAIADAGAQRALYTYNKITTAAITPCVQKNGGPPVTLTKVATISEYPFCGRVGGWNDPDARVGNGYFTYWVHPCVNAMPGAACSFGYGDTRTIKIVSEGCSNMDPNCAGGIVRRVAITAQGKIGTLSSEPAKAIGLDGITMSGWTEMEVDAATNGDLRMLPVGGCPGSDDPDVGRPATVACPRICVGDYGPDINVKVGQDPARQLATLPDTATCTQGRVNPPDVPKWNPAYPTANFGLSESSAIVKHATGKILLTPVDITAINASNSNDRLLAANLNQPGGDTTSGAGTVTFDPSTRTLTMDGTDPASRLALILDGGDYSLCKLVMTGSSQLVMAPRPVDAPVRIYFDSPEACGLSNPATQISVHDTSDISSARYNSNFNPFNRDSNGNPAPLLSLPEVAMVGSTAPPDSPSFIRTRAEFSNNQGWGAAAYANQLLLYAPRTDILLDTWARENEGYFAGKTIALSQGAEIESHPDIQSAGTNIAPPDFTLFRQKQYVECGPPGSTIDANC